MMILPTIGIAIMGLIYMFMIYVIVSSYVIVRDILECRA